MKAYPALERAPRIVMLYTVAGEYSYLAVVHFYREMDGRFAFAFLQHQYACLAYRQVAARRIYSFLENLKLALCTNFYLIQDSLGNHLFLQSTLYGIAVNSKKVTSAHLKLGSSIYKIFVLTGRLFNS